MNNVPGDLKNVMLLAGHFIVINNKKARITLYEQFGLLVSSRIYFQIRHGILLLARKGCVLHDIIDAGIVNVFTIPILI